MKWINEKENETRCIMKGGPFKDNSIVNLFGLIVKQQFIIIRY